MKAPRYRMARRVGYLINPFKKNGLAQPPGKNGDPKAASLEAYLSNVVDPTLNALKKEGAVAIKFPTAYERTLNIGKVSQSDASTAYKKLLSGRILDRNADARQLEDFLFFYISQKAGDLGLVVKIHVGIGSHPHFNISGSNPLLLETLVDSPEQQKTKFVLVHGGWPFVEAAGVMLMKPNVYADFSDQTFLRSSRAVSETIRKWMEWMPEKIMFGSDAYPDPGTPLAGWEEKLYVTTKSARNAVALALTGMMNDGQISRERALELAEMVLRTNAKEIYSLD
jgi:predicted TIM-barrel fold metal-dependent hydrolase